jgi:hypothetical protein
MTNPAKLQVACLLLLTGAPAHAQQAPASCLERGTLFFYRAAEHLVLGESCKEFVPESSTAFDRVLARYELEDTDCVAAARKRFLAEGGPHIVDLQALRVELREQSSSPEGARELRERCLSVEDRDNERREADKSLLPSEPWPAPGGG